MKLFIAFVMFFSVTGNAGEVKCQDVSMKGKKYLFCEGNLYEVTSKKNKLDFLKTEKTIKLKGNKRKVNDSTNSSNAIAK
jgi:hypothetical protein